MTFSLRAALTAALLASVAVPASAEQVFNRIASFPVAANLPADKDKLSPSSAEIVTASEDGMTLIYTDSPLGAIGFVDITDPKAPKPLGALTFKGEPTSVASVGKKVLAAVNTGESKQKPTGMLAVVDIATKKVDLTCDLGGQPDSIAVSKDKTFAVIAIENERDEEVNDGALPQMPAGDLVIVSLKDGTADCASIKHVTLTGLAGVAPEDPEPEFVAINDNGEIALTMQENNEIVIIDGKTGQVTGHFSAGKADLEGIDNKTDGQLSFTGKASALREPDAVKWLDNNRLVVANEGDWKGGSRGFTIFDRTGKVLYESGASLERAVARLGHFPEKRARSKGIEVEGMEAATFNGQKYLFLLAERASVVAVYKDTGAEPQLMQILPSGISPEGAVAIPGRNLFVTANEVDLGKDGGARSHVMIYALEEGVANYPKLVSKDLDGNVLGWGALSGLVGDTQKDGILYAVSDSVYNMQPSIFTIDTTRKPAEITGVLRITRGGQPAQKLDIEGIALDGKGGFWLASEGDSAKLTGHGLYNVDAKGEIKAEIGLPADLLAGETRFGFEGVTTVGSGDDMVLWMAMQREWKDDPKGTVKLVSYKPKSKEWGAVRYPLEKAGAGWVGLSEITAHGDYVYIIERDNLIGDAAKLKKLYRVAIADLKPAKIGTDLPVVKKEEAHDFIPDLKASNGYVVDKLEGFTFDKSGKAFAVTDNDGVDDSSGETLFFPVDLKGTN
ncbi:esterase-like activity of phytase family protein [Neorhizobium galegae]|uniref:esterase-like activity of phytase family protein n=1 Tax=Neorhizobium galegae TaxID=399 RepID=UPI0006218CC9|nr:esterase-like activity of phytase family protein [Neorhizobium galegae]CDZ27671.1 Alkaline phosphatase [Neorhizobium galegae bv. officinalis]KAA9386665.1 alkaline phosphatase [Neorhizobium galegae]KAB1109081.1 alkaline phosphatase [Neorhizobium galegae]MCM2501465.1 esterase-like activity of phytase family protein [Neorhizobium galegae]MCQ1772416.1 esterase-like activity of phytase family protein [Neorhizobium galegae]